MYIQEYRFSMILTSLVAKRLHLMTATTILESGEGGGEGEVRSGRGQRKENFRQKKILH